MKTTINDGVPTTTVNGAIVPQKFVRPSKSTIKSKSLIGNGGGVSVLNYEDSSLNAHLSDFGNPHRVTSEQVGSSEALWNANKLQGFDISLDDPSDGQILQWNESESQWEPVTPTTILISVSTATNLTGYLKGNGSVVSAIATVAATDLTGTINDLRLSSNVALKNINNNFLASQTVTGTLAATTLTGAGSGITALNGSNIASGTVADARLSANIPLLNTSNNFTGNINTTIGFSRGEAFTVDVSGNVVCQALTAQAGANVTGTLSANTVSCDQLNGSAAMFTGTVNGGSFASTGSLYIADGGGDYSQIVSNNITTTGTVSAPDFVGSRVSLNAGFIYLDGNTGNISASGAIAAVGDISTTSGNITAYGTVTCGVVDVYGTIYLNGGSGEITASSVSASSNITASGSVIGSNLNATGGTINAGVGGSYQGLVNIYNSDTLSGQLVIIDATGTGNNITATGANLLLSGGLYSGSILFNSSGLTADSGDIAINAPTGGISLTCAQSISLASGSTFTINANGGVSNLVFVNLPTSDPGVSGAVWQDGGYLRINNT